MSSDTALEAQPAAVGTTSPDVELLQRLRDGDEAAFESLVSRHHGSMIRVARSYVPSRAVAEEVTQETWLAVLSGIDRFEGRSSLKTWIFRILVNRAKTRGARERRSVAFSAMEARGEPTVDPDRFLPGDHPRYPGHWLVGPAPFPELPEDRVVAVEIMDRVRELIEALVPRQRAVITLRDVEGWSASEVCETLGLSEANQRVMLHRARASVRAGLERYFRDGDGPEARR